jgi:hypothetical protein
MALEGLLSHDGHEHLLRAQILPRIQRGMEEQEVYGEKNLSYGPFVSSMAELFNARFVLILRDGRDVVRSLLDWNNQKFGSIYRECEDVGGISDAALEAVRGIPLLSMPG